METHEEDMVGCPNHFLLEGHKDLGSCTVGYHSSLSMHWNPETIVINMAFVMKISKGEPVRLGGNVAQALVKFVLPGFDHQKHQLCLS